MIISCEADSKLPCILQLTRLPPIEGGANCSSKRESCSISTHLSLPICAQRSAMLIISPYMSVIIPDINWFEHFTMYYYLHYVKSHLYLKQLMTKLPTGFLKSTCSKFSLLRTLLHHQVTWWNSAIWTFAELKYCNFLAPLCFLSRSLPFLHAITNTFLSRPIFKYFHLSTFKFDINDVTKGGFFLSG